MILRPTVASKLKQINKIHTVLLQKYIPYYWETDLNKSLGLLSESQFVTAVQIIVYVFTCLYVNSFSNKNMFKLNKCSQHRNQSKQYIP